MNTIYLTNGPISPEQAAQEIELHGNNQGIGAHAVFMGRVRADEKDGIKTTGIEYTAYEEMIGKTVKEIRDELFSNHPGLLNVHILHSTGLVKTGEVSLFAIVSSGHRKEAFKALEDCVEQIKSRLPVWKKELFSDGSHEWKEG